ncbi:MAG: hypothetical protein AAFP89_25330 [Bacteroidota bacterium]
MREMDALEVKEIHEKYAMVKVFQPIGRHSDGDKLKMLIEFAKNQQLDGFLFDVRSFECDISKGVLYHFAHTDLYQVGFDRRLQIAMLHKPEDKSHDFFVLVCHNAGYNIKAFHSTEQAQLWLTKK